MLKTFRQNDKLLINFSLCNNVFKGCLLQSCQKASIWKDKAWIHDFIKTFEPYIGFNPTGGRNGC